MVISEEKQEILCGMVDHVSEDLGYAHREKLHRLLIEFSDAFSTENVTNL